MINVYTVARFLNVLSALEETVNGNARVRNVPSILTFVIYVSFKAIKTAANGLNALNLYHFIVLLKK